jgi:hypothetical protein
MIERALWTGLAALLTVLLGSTLSLVSSPAPACGAWLLMCVYAAAMAVVLLAVSGDSGGRGRTAGPWHLLLKVGAAFTGIVSLALLWWLTGAWIAFVIGCPSMIGVAAVATARPLGRQLHSPEHETASPGLWQSISLATDLLIVVLVLPLVGFTGAGALLSRYPWSVSAALVVSAISFVLATHPHILAVSDHGEPKFRDRLLTFGMTLVSLGGVVIVGRFFPGSSEIRLLAISGATVVSVLGLAAVLHPLAHAGRRLATIFVPISFLLLIAGFSLIYGLA